MKAIRQSEIAKKIGISRSYLCLILRGTRRVTQHVGRKMEEVTGTPWYQWMDYSPDQVKTELYAILGNPSETS
jgi:transcriptional regulator with XRE-family HTH domain